MVRARHGLGLRRAGEGRGEEKRSKGLPWREGGGPTGVLAMARRSGGRGQRLRHWKVCESRIGAGGE